MSFFQEDGVLDARSGTGTDVITLTGPGAGLPVKLIRITTNNLATTGPGNTHLVISVGMSDGTDDRCVTSYSEDNVGTSNAKKASHDDSVVVIYDSSGAVVEQGTISAIGDGTFTINWTIKTAAATKIAYTAWGGDEIDGVKLLTAAFETTGVNGVSVAYTGVGFQPSCMWFLGNDTTGSLNTVANHTALVVGVATAGGNPGEQGYTLATSENNRGTMDTGRRQRTTQCLIDITGSTQVLRRHSRLTSFDSDGWTQLDNVASTTPASFFAIAVSGGRWFVGNGTAPTSDSEKAYTTPFQPVGISVQSWERQTSNSNQTSNMISLGSSDGSVEYNIAAGDTAGVATSQCGVVVFEDGIVSSRTINAATIITSSKASIPAGGLFNATDFTLDWTTTDATARQLIFLACAEDAAMGSGLGSFIGGSITRRRRRR